MLVNSGNVMKSSTSKNFEIMLLIIHPPVLIHFTDKCTARKVSECYYVIMTMYNLDKFCISMEINMHIYLVVHFMYTN